MTDNALSVIRSGRDTAKTSTGQLPAALSCYFGVGASRMLVHLFDAAGEQYQDLEVQDRLAFLHGSRGLVYVLDPLSVRSLRDRIPTRTMAAAGASHAADGDPELAYQAVVSAMRNSGVKPKQQRLAVVVSKVDLLETCDIQVPNTSTAIADWLSDLGLHNMVLAAEREFAEVRYFPVASLRCTDDEASHDPGRPLLWLINRPGLRLSPPKQEVTRV